MEKSENKGSIWRKWDLHVHSPASYGGEYSEFIESAKKSEADVIGINDYCTIDGYKKIIESGGIQGKVLFPVIEFRMHNLLITKRNQNGVRINFHIIFDNNPDLHPKISTWIQSLKCKNEKGENAQLGTIAPADLHKVVFDFDETVDKLAEFGLAEHALVWLPYDEYGGIDEINPDTDGWFKLLLSTKLI